MSVMGLTKETVKKMAEGVIDYKHKKGLFVEEEEEYNTFSKLYELNCKTYENRYKNQEGVTVETDYNINNVIVTEEHK